MIQFLGLSFLKRAGVWRAVAVPVDRATIPLNASSAAVGGVTSVSESLVEVRPGEWIRAGSLALRDAFLSIPAKVRRVWGFALAGPPGWVALNPALEPITSVRLTPDPRADFSQWLATNPKEKPHIYSVLSPKDFFRHAVSGALAADVTQAEGFARLERGATRWDQADILAAEFLPSWFPPVFDSGTATGRISEDGIRHTGLPGGLWVAAGCQADRSALVSAGDLRTGTLLVRPDVSMHSEGAALEILSVCSHSNAPQNKALSSRAPLVAHRCDRWQVVGESPAETAEATAAALHRLAGETPCPLLDARPGDDLAALNALEVQLRPAPLRSPHFGKEDPGVAYLAGMAHGVFRGPDDLYRKLREAQSAEQ